MTWQPIPSPLMTRWTKEVRPDAVWPSYPRPQMAREAWRNLNGLWRYGVTPRDAASPRFQDDILVPFPIESALSGVGRPLLPDQRLWYRRTFEIPAAWRGQRILLHFGAVDWETTVWVNDRLAGTHRGGYLPFTFDITEHLRPGENELLVAAWDPTDAHWQARGKQRLKPGGIWYTAVSGIWQTVWLEPVPPTYIDRLRLIPDIDAGLLRASAHIAGDEGGERVEFIVWEGSREIARATARPGQVADIPLPTPRLWSPDDPHLYDFQALLHGRGVEDEARSYFGMRQFRVAPDARGRMRLHLNHRPLFHYGPLDQGYWPDGLYTPPTEAAMRFDVDFVKAAGCNMLRKHVKVEPAQFYAYCDRRGVIVWQDMPNGGREVNDVRAVIAMLLGRQARWRDDDYRKAGRERVESREDFRRELREMVDALFNHPCIGMWVPFNEGWGQFDARAVADWLKTYDPTRPVDHASGWFDQGGGDFLSIHTYKRRLKPYPPEPQRAVILSEFGGYTRLIPGHVWDSHKQYGYGRRNSAEALRAAYEAIVSEQMAPWMEAGLSGAVYTQLTDVETEINGWLTYDRAVAKLEADWLQKVHMSIKEKSTD